MELALPLAHSPDFLGVLAPEPQRQGMDAPDVGILHCVLWGEQARTHGSCPLRVPLLALQLALRGPSVGSEVQLCGALEAATASPMARV